MLRRILSLAFIGVTILTFSCTKIDTTNIGSDLIPAVDNVNTFADEFPVQASQNDYTDTTLVFNTADHALGYINDPLFGTTDASIYMQLKPSNFPYALPYKDSIIGNTPDSVVLCLHYSGFWGDSTQPQQLQVFEVNDQRFVDSVYKNWRTDEQPSIGSPLSNPVTVNIPELKSGNYIKYSNQRDSSNYQIRIKLSDAFANSLFNADSSTVGAFKNDSLFRVAFRGFAVKATAGFGNALLYVNLADTNTKLEVHYKIKSVQTPGKIDSTYTSFTLESGDLGFTLRSATANFIDRNRSGSPSANPSTDEIYLQTQPGTYAALKIPGLTGYTTRIIHRAELIVEEIPDVPNNQLTPPNYMYLDLKDTTTGPIKYKPIYYDLSSLNLYDPDFKSGYPYYPSGGVEIGNFGGYARKKTDPISGQSITYYNINMTRYVQQMVTKQTANYDLRLFPASLFHYPQYSAAYITYNNNVANGRIRVGSGTNTNYKMRLRIVYSPIK